ncbi:hypothetical protein QR680_000356 [Steinernema hermaphroditum]|uniref:Uncharacterized protein n=1 Tax=Steinernema hermaphroditum TaxID=289476 RepID=A0AA39LDG1_9BILA|nr:hypothetical protein QR680_000356 [Steinernema hermaphroditum]
MSRFFEQAKDKLSTAASVFLGKDDDTELDQEHKGEVETTYEAKKTNCDHHDNAEDSSEEDFVIHDFKLT